MHWSNTLLLREWMCRTHGYRSQKPPQLEPLTLDMPKLDIPPLELPELPKFDITAPPTP